MASILTHFTHPIPNHYLRPMEKAVDFECGACKQNLGPIDGYKCNSCDFMLHGICASMGDSSSDVITSFMHPQHGLTLLPEHCQKELGRRACNFCRYEVRGMWYRCAACDFDVHPLCTKLPQFISDPAHPEHQLRFVPGRLGARCGLCKGDCCWGWIYRCDRCDFDCHLMCLAKSCSKTNPYFEVNTSAGGGTRRRKTGIVGKILLGMVGIAVEAVVGNGVGDAITGLFS